MTSRREDGCCLWEQERKEERASVALASFLWLHRQGAKNVVECPVRDKGASGAVQLVCERDRLGYREDVSTAGRRHCLSSSVHSSDEELTQIELVGFYFYTVRIEIHGSEAQKLIPTLAKNKIWCRVRRMWRVAV
jgi:hypothetical protein